MKTENSNTKRGGRREERVLMKRENGDQQRLINTLRGTRIQRQRERERGTHGEKEENTRLVERKNAPLVLPLSPLSVSLCLCRERFHFRELFEQWKAHFETNLAIYYTYLY